LLPKPGRCLSRMLPKLEAGPDVWPCAVLPLHPARPAAARLRRACVAAHSRAAADPSEIPLRPSQIRTSGDYPKRIEQSTFVWALTMVTFPIEATRREQIVDVHQPLSRSPGFILPWPHFVRPYPSLPLLPLLRNRMSCYQNSGQSLGVQSGK
jgi:hypothetical protein